jgi:hypothetical protein
MKTVKTCEGFDAVTSSSAAAAVSVAAHGCSFLDVGLQAEQGRRGARGVLVDPAVVQLADRHRVQVVQLRAPDLVRRDEPRGLEDPQVLSSRRWLPAPDSDVSVGNSAVD